MTNESCAVGSSERGPVYGLVPSCELVRFSASCTSCWNHGALKAARFLMPRTPLTSTSHGWKLAGRSAAAATASFHRPCWRKWRKMFVHGWVSLSTGSSGRRFMAPANSEVSHSERASIQPAGPTCAVRANSRLSDS